MQSDHYTKVVLTVLAVGLWSLLVTRWDAPAAEARSLATSGAVVAPAAATSTLPLRWRVPFARHIDAGTSGFADCVTIASVVNFSPSVITVEVEFFDHIGTSVGMTTDPLQSGTPDLYATGITNTVPVFPFGAVIDDNAGTENFAGYALVFASDPRIFVGAYLVCRDDGATSQSPFTLTNLSAYPVGATLQFFQAGIPGTGGSPPLVMPEIP